MNCIPRPPALPAGAVSLHGLVRNGDFDRLRAALDAGADPDARDRWGLTPLLLAVRHRRTEAIPILGRAGADPDLPRSGMGEFTPLHEAAHRDSLDAVRALLEIGADASQRTWLTPLDWAEGPPVIRALVAAGADPDARCPETGSAPLHRRACRALPAAIAALLDAGADVAALDSQGRAPLHHVTLGHRRGDVARTVALLIDAGADPQAVDGNGETVMDLARRRRDAVTLSALREAGLRRENPLACPPDIA